MKHYLLLTALLLTSTAPLYARGLLIPSEPDLPPLAMLNHHVEVEIEDQAAVTRVMQTFRNHTDRKLEAKYVFPVPAGASVQKFVIWVDGQPMKGELLKAEAARSTYNSIVRQTKNPALLDYVGSDLLQLKIYPVPAKGEQKVEVRFTAIAKKDHEIVEYLYPLKTDRAAASTLEEFRLSVDLKSQRKLGNIYSPSHPITVTRHNDKHASILYEEQAVTLDRDFQMFYDHSDRDVGVTAMLQRPSADQDGYVMLLASPRAELDQKAPRDIVFVLDSSGSMMHENKMEQAKKALRHCLGELSPQDRFGLIHFATTVNHYRDQLTDAKTEHVKHAQGWVADQYAGGGTAISAALKAALAMRSDDPGRMFTVMFFTDGKPTIGETDADKILVEVKKQNNNNTRIFSLGVGDNLNAVLLDQLAEQTRALSRYIRPGENLETNVAHFFNKINHPVLANLKLRTGDGVRLTEVYPPQLPDLFHGDQLVVLARYQGQGDAAIFLDGWVGPEQKQFVYELEFPDHASDKPFVEELWARRKVGYLLDQIRVNGEQQELVDEVVRLSKNYGITTPYTSYLIMPDAPVEVASATAVAGKKESLVELRRRYNAPRALARADQQPQKVEDFAKNAQRNLGDLARNRGAFQDRAFRDLDEKAMYGFAGGGRGPAAAPAPSAPQAEAQKKLLEAKRLKGALDAANMNYRSGQWRRNQVNKLGVDLAICTNNLKCQTQLQAAAVRRVNSRNCLEIGGVWIDEAFTAKTKTLAVKAQSDAYFQILQRHPRMKEVFGLGNHVVWIAPNGMGLVIDANNGAEKLADSDIDRLFKK